MPCTVITNSGELYHYGILGQKWGQRNGPPYPLGASDHSAREKAAGYTKSIKKARSEYTKGRNERYKQYKNTRSELLKERKANTKALKENRNKYENDHSAKEKYKSDLKKVVSDVKNDVKENVKSIDKDKVLKAAKIGAAVAASGLAAYGAYKIIKSGKMAKGRASEREAIRLIRAGLGVDLNSPGQTTAVNRGNSAAFRVAMDRSRFNAKSSLAKNTYDYTSKVIDTGQTSALRVFDNIVKGSAAQATYSLDRNSVNKNGFAGRISDGEYLMGDLSMDLFNKWRYEGPYRVLKNLD